MKGWRERTPIWRARAEVDHKDSKPLFPDNVILGAGVYSRIKIDNQPQIGNKWEPWA